MIWSSSTYHANGYRHKICPVVIIFPNRINFSKLISARSLEVSVTAHLTGAGRTPSAAAFQRKCPGACWACFSQAASSGVLIFLNVSDTFIKKVSFDLNSSFVN